MPVPKRKRSRPRRDSRFANKGIAENSIIRCATVDCTALSLLPHQACHTCGMYRGEKVMRTKNERTQVRTLKKQEKTNKAAATPEENA